MYRDWTQSLGDGLVGFQLVKNSCRVVLMMLGVNISTQYNKYVDHIFNISSIGNIIDTESRFLLGMNGQTGEQTDTQTNMSCKNNDQTIVGNKY